MTAEVRSVVVKLTMAAAEYIATAKTAGDTTEKAMLKARVATLRQGQALDDLGGKSGKIAAGATVALGLMAKAAIDWESQWAGVTKTVDGTTEQLTGLEDGLREMARTMPATHEEIAGVAEAAGQLGVAVGDIESFTETMIMLGETTNLTAEDAATDIAQISNVMGTGADDVDNFGAALVALGNDGASTEAQILGMAQRIAGAGAQIGLAESDILAIANAAASMGIEVEAGGTAISTVFSEMAKATAQGGEDLDAFAKVAGVSSQEFTQAFEDDPARAFASFTEGLDRINQSGGDVFTTLDTLGLADQRVSRALLGMAASGDLLSDSLDLGAEAFAENTALIEEYAKRYDTTAAKTQVAWNKIKDAGIDAGGALLPVVAEIASGVGKVADAFGDLPDPAQSAITKLLALTAITGGAAWFGAKVYNGINTTKDAIRALGTESTATKGKLNGLTVAAGAATALLVLGEALDVVAESGDRAAPNVEGLTRDLLNWGDSDAMKGIAADLGDLGAAIDTLDDPSILKDVADFYNDIPLGGFTDNVIPGLQSAKKESREAASALKGLDEALAGMVAQGAPEEAATALANLADAYNLTGEQQENLTKLLPNYQEALDGLANSAALAGIEFAALPDSLPDDSIWAAFYADTNAAADAAAALGYSSSLSADEALKQAEALAAVRDAAAETASSFFDLTSSIDDNTSTLSGWIKEMADQADALTNFTLNAVEAGEKGVKQGLIDQLRELGPEGAKQLRWLANASDKEIAAANRAWQRGQDAIDDYSDAITGVPALNMEIQDAEGRARIREIQRLVDKFGMTKAEAQAFIRDAATDKVKAVQRLVDQYGITKAEATALLRDMASGDIKAVRALLRDLNGDEAVTYITTVRRTRVEQAPGGMGGRPEMATGGLLRGPGTKTSDSIPVMGSDGEYMVRAAAVDHYGVGFFDRVNALHLAGGGPVTHTSRSKPRGDDWLSTQLNFTVGQDVDKLRDALRDLRTDLKEAGRDWTGAMQRQSSQLLKLTRSYEKQTEKLDRLQDRSDAFAGEVAGSFNNDLFGNGLAGLDLQLDADTNDSQAMEAALKKAAKRGLDGGLFAALSASGDIGTAEELANLSRSEIAAYERKFAARNRAGESLGGFAAQEQFGAVIQRTERFLGKNEQAIIRLVHTLEGLPGNVEDGVRLGNADRNRRIRSSVRAGVR